jgi:peptidoglycan/xylan/chitin deacetylase (PgdA/CDA1 family)
VIESPAKALELWRLELDALVDDEGLFILTCHPFISGRPSRVRALDQLIEHARARRDVWFASLGEIAAYVHATLPASQARPLSLVRIEEGVYV